MTDEEFLDRYEYTSGLIEMFHGDLTGTYNLNNPSIETRKAIAIELLEDCISLGTLDECIDQLDIDTVNIYSPTFDCDHLDKKILMTEFLGISSIVPADVIDRFLINVYHHNIDIIQSIIGIIESMGEESSEERLAYESVERCKGV